MSIYASVPSISNFFDIFTAALHIWRPSPRSATWGCVTGTHITQPGASFLLNSLRMATDSKDEWTYCKLFYSNTTITIEPMLLICRPYRSLTLVPILSNVHPIPSIMAHLPQKCEPGLRKGMSSLQTFPLKLCNNFWTVPYLVHALS